MTKVMYKNMTKMMTLLSRNLRLFKFFSLIGFLFPVYAYSKGASTMEIGLSYSIFFLFTILMRPLVEY